MAIARKSCLIAEHSRGRSIETGAYMRGGGLFNLTKIVSVLHKELECSHNRLLTVATDQYSLSFFSE